MTPETANPDQGIRVVAPHIDLTEVKGPGVVTFAAFPGGSSLPIAGFGDGTIATLAPGAAELSILAKLGATPIAGTGDVDGSSVLVGTDDGRLVSVSAQGAEAVIAEENGTWIGQVAVHQGSMTRAYAFDRTVVLLDREGSELARFENHESTVVGLAFSPDGSEIACAHYEGISVHGLDGSSQVLDWHGSHTKVTWSPDGKFIVSALQENEMHCWRMPEGKGMRMSGYPSKIRALSWTADSQYLAASGADVVTSWNFSGKGPAGKAPTEFGYVYNGLVTCVAAHPASHEVAGGYSDGTVLVGSIEKETASIARPGGGAKVSALNWAPDGSSLVAGTETGELALCLINPAPIG
ncbi:MAG: WD40 repeat domain-containing protein [Magnetovibrionaceae bacterium]